MYSFSFDIRSLQRRALTGGAIAEDAAAVPTPLDLAFDGPIRPREEAIFWLRSAAEIEHALMVQYLFAAYSLDADGAAGQTEVIRDAQFRLLQIAREEMGHLMTVQNVIMALGGPLHFERAHSPLSSDVHPFRFRLEPVSLASIAKYVVAESPDVPPDMIGMLSDERRALLRDVIHPLARASNDGHEVLHVGPIFARLVTLIGRELGDEDFRLDRAPRQAVWDDWGYDASTTATPSAARGERVLVHSIRGTTAAEVRTEIVAALRAIGDQGEFVDERDDLEESHFERFVQLFESLRAVEAASGRLPVWPIAQFPNTSMAGAAERRDSAADALISRHMNEGRITNARSRAWAHLFNLRYRLLIEVIAHGLLVDGPLYRLEPEARGRRTPAGQLHAFAFAEMVNIRLLSAKLVSLRLDDGESGLHAGPPFELGQTVGVPQIEADRWRSHADRFAAGSEWAQRISSAHPEDADDPFLVRLVETDKAAWALCLAIERTGDSPPGAEGETRFGEVLRALEEGVRGFDVAEQPNGTFHGNFWAGRTRDQLVAYRTPLGSTLIRPGSPEQSALLDRIGGSEGQRSTMPRARPALPPERLRLIAGWIADGAPDAVPNGAIGLTRMPKPRTESRRMPPGPVPPLPPPDPAAPVFETDVRPIFNDFHREMMLTWFDLHSYEQVKANHIKIRARLEDGSMPCPEGGGPLPPGDIATFNAWIEGGFRTNGGAHMPIGVTEPVPPGQQTPQSDPSGGFENGPYRNHRWRPTNAPFAPGTGVPRYDDVWHIDRNVGWAVDSDGYILATRDGWQTFMVQRHIPQTRMRCIGFANERVGWIGNVGAPPQERLLKTTDGGTNWNFVESLPSPNPKQICGLWVVSEDVVYLAGSNENEGTDPGRATVLKTTDGGTSWTEIDMEVAASAKTLIDVYFEDADRGWVVGGVDTVQHPSRGGRRGDLVPGIFRTTDGGRNWTNVVEGTRLSSNGRRYVGRTGVFAQGEWGWKIQRIDATTLVVAVQNYRDGIVLRSDDGGETWDRLRINDKQRNSNLEGIGFLDRTVGWVGGYGDISYQAGFSSMTFDGGRSWVDANHVGNRINRFRIVGPTPSVVYASGDTIYKFSDEPVPPRPADTLAAADEVVTVFEGWDRLDFPVEVPEGTGQLAVRIWERDGRFVRLLADEAAPAAGARTITWDFRNDDGNLEDVGAFVVRVTLDGRSQGRLAYRKR